MGILKAMKSLATLFFILSFSLAGLAKDPETKTFLLLFKSKELKELQLSLHRIESQFSPFFSTKSYEGNSELALLLEIPSCDFDACFLGEFLVDVGANQKIQIQEVAFRLYDLSDNQKLIADYLDAFDSEASAKKKQNKLATSSPAP